MLDQEDGWPASLHDRAEDGGEPLGLPVVEARRRFVEQQQREAAGVGPGQFDEPALTG